MVLTHFKIFVPSYKNQQTNLPCKITYWFPYDGGIYIVYWRGDCQCNPHLMESWFTFIPGSNRSASEFVIVRNRAKQPFFIQLQHKIILRHYHHHNINLFFKPRQYVRAKKGLPFEEI